MFSRFFIERPIFAAVVAILIALAGGVAMLVLPVQQYPSITPERVRMTAPMDVTGSGGADEARRVDIGLAQ